jgi:arsenate reductase-like glutaredoxin family protein
MIEEYLNEVTVFHNSKLPQDKKIIAFLQSNYDHVRTFDVATQSIKGTLLEEIAIRLNITVKELLKEDNRPELESDVDYIKWIQHNPEMLKTPILVAKEKAIFAQNQGDIAKIL